jgi:uncharacterized protein (TIGR02646 family)
MRAIVKQTEPNSLAQYRATADADYGGYRDKDTLRQHLVREQRGLCCYCLSRIRADRDSMKIEHWHSQSNPLYKHEQLDYSNLLGACKGNERPVGSDILERDLHCDASKGSNDLSKNPANPMHQIESSIRFDSSGRISSEDAAFAAELDQVLNR